MTIKWTKKDVIARVQEAMSTAIGTGIKPNILEKFRQRAMSKPEVVPGNKLQVR